MPKPNTPHYDPPKTLSPDGKVEIDLYKGYDPRYDHIAYQVCKKSGYCIDDLAEAFGVDATTMRKWQERFPSLRTAILAGRDEFDSEEVERAFLRKAKGYEFTEVRVEEIETDAEDEEGNKIKVPGQKITRITKHNPPDVAAGKFWLVNRNKSRWTPVAKLGEHKQGDDDTMKIIEEINLDKLSDAKLEKMRRALLEEGDDSDLEG